MPILSRIAKIGIPIAAVVVAGTAYNAKNQRSDLIAYAATADFSRPYRREKPFTRFGSSVRYADVDEFDDIFPRQKWDSNWDNREPIYMVDEKKLKKAITEEEKKELLSKAKPVAKRNILLIRHGQYNMNSENKDLTLLGREQASLLGKRLAVSGKQFDTLIMSTLPRATETAKIMLAEMDPVQTRSDSLLEEGAPYPPEPPVGHWRPKHHGPRIEAAFRKYIHRAPLEQTKDSYEIIVCHANVIRYFICRALQFPPEGWLRFSLGNTSITWIVISPSGRVSVRAIGDIGHLPSDKISFS